MRIVTSVLIALLATACSKDKTCPDPMPSVPSIASFAQLAVGNYWVYEGYLIDPNTQAATLANRRDSIYIDQEITVNNKVHYHMAGTRFGNIPFSRTVRVEGPQLLDENDAILLDLNSISDTVTTSQGWSVVDSTATVLQSGSRPITTPSGSYVSEHWSSFVLYLSLPYQSPQLEEDLYVEGVGIATFTATYVSSGQVIEMRLVDYNVQ